ncbi:hypothetical protein [Pseudosulfitobacter sp. DSM 107133]|uniref:hypothetical protein n=1 Tax=Pseudosulfitobacter sp. DSM 107133 TaxID=2883100 RepID=UPI001F081862|nr:hypothetical protein [Pseudosulfitobacter sp. DSM 107133]
MNQHRQYSVNLRILAACDVAQQQAGAFAGQFSVVSGNAQGVGLRGKGQQPKGAQPKCQAT